MWHWKNNEVQKMQTQHYEDKKIYARKMEATP